MFNSSSEFWFGTTPSTWPLMRFGACFTERRQIVSDSHYRALSVTMNGIILQMDNVAKSRDGDNRKLVQENDYVINSRSDRKGSSGISIFNGSVSLISIVLQPLCHEPSYIHYLLRSQLFIEEFYRNGHGIVADLWTTRFADIKSIPICVPPRTTQTRIAKFLDQKTALINKAITQKYRLLELLEEHRQILIHRAVTGGLDAGVELKDSGVELIGDVPRHWEVRRLKTIAVVQSGFTLNSSRVLDPDKGIPYLRVANVQFSGFNLESLSHVVMSDDEAINYQISAGDVLVTEGGDIDKLGRGTVWEGETPNIMHQNHVFCIKPICVNSYFMSYYLASLPARIYFQSTAVKTTNLASTNRSKLMNLSISLPPLEEQDRIVRYLEYFDSKNRGSVNTLKMSISRLQEYKTTLINAAVTGQIEQIEV